MVLLLSSWNCAKFKETHSNSVFHSVFHSNRSLYFSPVQTQNWLPAFSSAWTNNYGTIMDRGSLMEFVSLAFHYFSISSDAGKLHYSPTTYILSYRHYDLIIYFFTWLWVEDCITHIKVIIIMYMMNNIN